ncbi:hypothetical protein CAL7716_044000 [Calothrix sp. PCC 7716]|nr:hypothetical protein CAL7716_044000 [Calothrix sp. PCC 7716]
MNHYTEKVDATCIMTKIQSAVAKVLPDGAKTEMHRQLTEPGSAN